MNDPTSRYHDLPTAMLRRADGSELAYLTLRVIPPQAPGPASHVVTRQGERLDALAGRTVGDPLQFWRLCDANAVLDPLELVGPSGRILRLPFGQG